MSLLREAKRHRERDWLVILVTFWHGLRASEVIQITPDHLADGFLALQRLKGSQKTTQPLISSPEPLLNERDALFEFVRGIPRNQRLFKFSRRTFYNIVSRHAATAGLPAHKRHPHMLKHSIAMYLIDKIALNKLQKWLGHESLSSTGEYTKVSDEAAAAAVLEALKV